MTDLSTEALALRCGIHDHRKAAETCSCSEIARKLRLALQLEQSRNLADAQLRKRWDWPFMAYRCAGCFHHFTTHLDIEVPPAFLRADKISVLSHRYCWGCLDREELMTRPGWARPGESPRERMDELARNRNATGRRVIHYCNESSQPYVHLVCTDEWTTPAWSSTADTDCYPFRNSVHYAEAGRLYAFDPAMVTCPECRKQLST